MLLYELAHSLLQLPSAVWKLMLSEAVLLPLPLAVLVLLLLAVVLLLLLLQ